MAHDVRVGGTTGHPGAFAPTAHRVSAFVDFEANNEVMGQVVSCINVPINCCIEKAWIEVVRAEGAALTLDLGITGGTTDGFCNGVDGNAVAAVWEPACTYAAGVMVSAASVIALIPMTGDNASAVYVQVWVHAEIVDLAPNA